MRLASALVRSSVGRKTVMAVTGIGALAFLVVHLAGDTELFSGAAAFDGYGHFLHSLEILPVLEVILGAMFLAHVVFALLLTVQNWFARPVRYAVDNSEGNRSLASSTMIYSGIVILLFICVHLLAMRFDDPTGANEFTMAIAPLTGKLLVFCYLVGIAALGLHLWHGVGSCFQTLGLMSSTYEKFLTRLGQVIAVILAGGFLTVLAYIVFSLAREIKA